MNVFLKIQKYKLFHAFAISKTMKKKNMQIKIVKITECSFLSGLFLVLVVEVDNQSI